LKDLYHCKARLNHIWYAEDFVRFNCCLMWPNNFDKKDICDETNW